MVSSQSSCWLIKSTELFRQLILCSIQLFMIDFFVADRSSSRSRAGSFVFPQLISSLGHRRDEIRGLSNGTEDCQNPQTLPTRPL